MPENEFELYLTLLAKTLRLSDAQRDAIAAELRDHLEQRLEELTEAGHSREQAIRLALDEFGDASALATDLTRPRTQRRRRRIMKTTFGTLAACAAVTYLVMTFTPTNFQGDPTQPPANAQGQADSFEPRFADGEQAGDAAADADADADADDFEVSILVVDCAALLPERKDAGTLSQRTVDLANAVERTVEATRGDDIRKTIQVEPFEQFLIITADPASHEQAQRLLSQLADHVALRQAREKERARAEQDQRERLEAERVSIRSKLFEVERELQVYYDRQEAIQDAIDRAEKNGLGEDHTHLQQLHDQHEALRDEIERLQIQAQQLKIEFESLSNR